MLVDLHPVRMRAFDRDSPTHWLHLLVLWAMVVRGLICALLESVGFVEEARRFNDSLALISHGVSLGGAGFRVRHDFS